MKYYWFVHLSSELLIKDRGINFGNIFQSLPSVSLRGNEMICLSSDTPYFRIQAAVMRIEKLKLKGDTLGFPNLELSRTNIVFDQWTSIEFQTFEEFWKGDEVSMAAAHF